jgi:hypothetical protein
MRQFKIDEWISDLEASSLNKKGNPITIFDVETELSDALLKKEVTVEECKEILRLAEISLKVNPK